MSGFTSTSNDVPFVKSISHKGQSDKSKAWSMQTWISALCVARFWFQAHQVGNGNDDERMDPLSYDASK
ncbi:hypothetical protein V6N11_004119 [Hibiscus sabdariffa]|uniref:Uncharacterized protein n=1 Tax=Hibiscus sabdariffa TaxID=183260 RepID=A0ABR2SG86_9ROSI